MYQQFKYEQLQAKTQCTIYSDGNNLIKLVLKSCLTSIEDCE